MSTPPPRLTVTGSSDRHRRGGSDRGLRPVAELPLRARAFLVVAGLAIVAFAAWATVRLLQGESRALAIVLIALGYMGAVVVGIAIVTLTRLAFSLRALPYLLGRGVRRMLTRRR